MFLPGSVWPISAGASPWSSSSPTVHLPPIVVGGLNFPSEIVYFFPTAYLNFQCVCPLFYSGPWLRHCLGDESAGKLLDLASACLRWVLYIVRDTFAIYLIYLSELKIDRKWYQAVLMLLIYKNSVHLHTLEWNCVPVYAFDVPGCRKFESLEIHFFWGNRSLNS